ncbi:MAG TPA: UDP-N-acetylenolpyruvoylglucosamine reductase [Cryomorphaceae bacterium]|nr:UDP-N-acetylenolpyruvoylglucosamine reductase [Owenweeksia sp.]MBF98957.1 UDP-N-acetylenolpyruvoylglucosamine reductase [Owenweeksia sp.]HAD96942.1 UDP-N-acetylenolpyruvoylglucosamine reductase [Cryomorphaceae bacterium]HBF21036.1 UDP-N-acetylenolpyruvoylglucosamine reductase [Cryomorphaceae bacterium]HCQ15515.1 UDP-N-acetylenolpyruvoylglucosamine reductase [Cryomorphaceae bacterium]|tara:strand:- start:906 stop:1931 length:1026 start_codon:yes stop_codon:yes gene_type:complete
MTEIRENVSLKPYNTFGIDVKARYFSEAGSLEELRGILDHNLFKTVPVLWMGGGSNMLLVSDFEGWVIRVNLRGKHVEEKTDAKVVVSACAGENWHQFVLWTLEQNLGGLENLSLIPGNVGTAPMQNIGAYGAEIKDTFLKLEGLNIQNGELETFDREQCAFGYRESVFKRSLKGKYIITKVYFSLTPEAEHSVNTQYGAIEAQLSEMGTKATIHSVSEAVIAIRSSKLPNPKEIGNSGSFFKNPVVSAAQVEELKKTYPDLVAYPVSEKEVKLAAGWLIEKAGWKGYRKGDAGVHKNQALVLVNYGNASGKEIVALSREIQQSVFRTFGVPLEAEVNIIE